MSNGMQLIFTPQHRRTQSTVYPDPVMGRQPAIFEKEKEKSNKLVLGATQYYKAGYREESIITVYFVHMTG